MRKSGGFKWMQIASIMGFVFFAVGVIFYFLSLINVSLDFLSAGVIRVIIIVSFLLNFVYVYGFFKLGKYSNSKILRVFSILLVISLVLLAVSGIVIKNNNLSRGNFLTGNAVGELDVSQYIGASHIPSLIDFGTGLMLALILCSLVFRGFVSFGMFKSNLKLGKGKDFSKMAGVLGMIVAVIGVVFWIYYVRLLNNIMLLFSMIASTSTIETWVNVFIIAFLGALFFESLTLSNASKKYE